MLCVLQNTIPGFYPPQEFLGKQVPRSGLATTAWNDMGKKSEEIIPISLSWATMLCTLSPDTQDPNPAAHQWCLFSQSFSSSKYTSTLQCLTNRPCSTTCKQEESMKEHWFHIGQSWKEHVSAMAKCRNIMIISFTQGLGDQEYRFFALFCFWDTTVWTQGLMPSRQVL
jgi:hypothetical protein